MKMVMDNYSNTIPFSDLAEGETYREESGGTVYMKLQIPIGDKHGNVYNAVTVGLGCLDYTPENANIFPVDGTFIENYKEKG